MLRARSFVIQLPPFVRIKKRKEKALLVLQLLLLLFFSFFHDFRFSDFGSAKRGSRRSIWYPQSLPQDGRQQRNEDCRTPGLWSRYLLTSIASLYQQVTSHDVRVSPWEKNSPWSLSEAPRDKYPTVCTHKLHRMTSVGPKAAAARRRVVWSACCE